jgi:hypothetical protein
MDSWFSDLSVRTVDGISCRVREVFAEDSEANLIRMIYS